MRKYLVIALFALALVLPTQPVHGIVGGASITIQQRPSAVAIVLHSQADAVRGYMANGTLIGTKWILTTASAFIGLDAPDIDAIVGQADISAPLSGERIRVKAITMHPSFDGDTYDNDLAIIELEQAVSVQTASAATIPAQGDPEHLATANVAAQIAGWGSTRSSDPVFITGQLTATTIHIVDQTVLSADYDGLYPVTVNMLGARDNGRDACSGDNGASLFISQGHDTYLAGMMSWGIGCDDSRYPGVYTRVSQYADWISSIIAPAPSSAATISSTGTGSIGVSTSTGSLTGVMGLYATDASIRQANKPEGFTFPDGVISYKITGLNPGDSATVTLTFPSGVPSGWKIFKADSTGFADLSQYATEAGDSIILTLTDGGRGDSDGAQDGVITDPIGLAIPRSDSNGTSNDGNNGGGGDGGCIYDPTAPLSLDLAGLLLTGLAIVRRQIQFRK